MLMGLGIFSVAFSTQRRDSGLTKSSGRRRLPSHESELENLTGRLTLSKREIHGVRARFTWPMELWEFQAKIARQFT